MRNYHTRAKRNRKYIAHDLQIETWDSIQGYFLDLETRELKSCDDLETWLLHRAELDAVLEEEMAWRYIEMNCDTNNEHHANRFNAFVEHIEPHISSAENKLDKKLLLSPFLNQIDQKKYLILIRALQKRDALFREKNVPILTELQKMEQEYGKIASQMTIDVDGKTITLQQASVYLKNTNRDIRKNVFIQIQERRRKDEEILHTLLTNLIEKRHTCAVNADFANYRDYKFEELGRFDYTKEDCFNFHSSIQKTIPPLIANIQNKRKQSLQLNILKPWDLDVDPNNLPPLTPFKTSEELIQKTIACLHDIKPQYAEYIQTMVAEGYVDLESRIGKAPGGFNYPLYESNIPFIFMNSAGTLHDVETMLHESGHAIHSCITAKLPLIEFKSLPSEVAELASMSMELISMEHWHHFFDTPEELNRAKRSQLEGTLSVLSWVAIVDKFQHWLYENPTHTIAQRETKWLGILAEYDTGVVDWSDLQKFTKSNWQRQLHIFEVPFYYIEYGIAQLGAIALWRQYSINREQALQNYENFLRLGYTVPIPEIYKAAGIDFSFSLDYVTELMDFVKQKLEML